MTKTKKEIIEKMAAESGMTKKDCGTAVNALIDVIGQELKEGNKVQLMGLGTFEPRERNPRECRNPQTGEKMMTEKSVAAGFKASKALKDLLNS